jgi:predicted transcriptional regulator
MKMRNLRNKEYFNNNNFKRCKGRKISIFFLGIKRQNKEVKNAW